MGEGGMRGRMRGRRGEREAREACSCVSILNNHVCVRALARHRRTASVVEVIGPGRKNRQSTAGRQAE